MVEDKTYTSIEVDVPLLSHEACPIPRRIVVAEALDNLVSYISWIGISNRVGKILCD